MNPNTTVSILMGLLTIGMAVLGGHVSSSKPWQRWAFYVMGFLSFFLILAQGWLSQKTQENMEIEARRARNEAQEASSKLEKLTKSVGNVESRLSKSPKESDEIAQRAWVGIVSIGPIVIVPNKQLSLSITISNTGRSPAFNVASFSVNNILDRHITSETKLPLKGPIPPVQSSTSLGANETRTGTHAISPFSAEQVDAVKNGTAIWYHFGWITYQDTFSVDRKTDFCYFYEPAKDVFTYCAGHNSFK